MLITLIQDDPLTPPLKIAVAEDRADAVMSAMATAGWRVLSKHYGPLLAAIDCLQVAFLQISTLPADAPIRVAVELGASAAIVSEPLSDQGRSHLPGSKSGGDECHSGTGDSIHGETDRRHGQDKVH